MVQNGKKPRRTQAERRLATQTAIMNASVGILVTEGYARFSASRVASLAGVSRGAQEHYYPKKFDLIEAVTRQIMEGGQPWQPMEVPRAPVVLAKARERTGW